MSLRRVIVLAGAVLLIAGVIALLVPVSVAGNGESVGCGNAIAADRRGANIPVLNQFIPHTTYQADCRPRCRTGGSGRYRWR